LLETAAAEVLEPEVVVEDDDDEAAAVVGFAEVALDVVGLAVAGFGLAAAFLFVVPLISALASDASLRASFLSIPSSTFTMSLNINF